jgi:hypothetical protein
VLVTRSTRRETTLFGDSSHLWVDRIAHDAVCVICVFSLPFFPLLPLSLF